jgi:hypothetical protein
MIRNFRTALAVALLFVPEYAHAYIVHRQPTIWFWLWLFALSPFAMLWALPLACGSCLFRKWRLAAVFAFVAALSFLLNWCSDRDWSRSNLFWGDYEPLPPGVLSFLRKID